MLVGLFIGVVIGTVVVLLVVRHALSDWPQY